MSDLGFAAAKQLTSPWPETAPVASYPERAIADDPSQSLRAQVKASRLLFSIEAMALDFVAIFAAFLLSDSLYNLTVYGAMRHVFESAQLGFFAAFLFAASNVKRHCYAIAEYLDLAGHAQRVFVQWNLAFLAAAASGFLFRVIADSSRGSFIVFYFVGLAALYAGRATLVTLTKRDAQKGAVLAARVMIVGFRADIAEFLEHHPMAKLGMHVVATRELDADAAAHDVELAEAVELARRLMPDDIVIVAPLERAAVIDKCITALMRVPAALHLHLDRNNPLHRFSGRRFSGDSSISSFRLPANSMNSVGAAAKRACDIILSIVALILLAPLLAAVAIAIKLDTKGPVFYSQTRHGFNKTPFRILKFRSMTATEADSAVQQAVRNDPRVTRVGRFMRRFNIDELPQIVNVLRGEMSLVGPRPHALVHDMTFETEISLYARRHNVKPGITGWAQVNGLRGETNTPDKIWQRVHYDLHYIDNWSLVLDIWIMFLTLFSRKAYANAR